MTTGEPPLITTPVTTGGGNNSTTTTTGFRPAGGGGRRRGVKGPFDYSSVEPRNFLPCPFQVKLFEEAKWENLIVCLENDFGKTFIAVKLLEYFAFQIRDSKCGRKFSVIVDSNSENLTFQATTVRNHVDMQVVTACEAPSGKTALLDKTHWTEQLSHAQVLAVHPQVLLELFHQKFISMEDINLLVMNELHLHLNDPQYLRIMEFYTQCADVKPRLLGLAANILQNQIGYTAVANLVHLLESRFQSKCRTIFNNYSRPKEIVYEYSVETCTRTLKNVNNFDELFAMIRNLVDFVNRSKIKPKADAPIQLNQIREYFDNLAFVLEHLGVWCAWKLCDLYVFELSSIVASYMSKDGTYSSILSAVLSQFHYARLFFEQILERYSIFEQLIKLSSNKLVCFVQNLGKFYFEKLSECQEQQEQGIVKKAGVNDDHFSCIVFCQQRLVVRLLDAFIKEMTKWDLLKFFHIHSDFVIGQNLTKRNKSELLKSNRKQEEALLRFKKHETNVLIACSVFEERLDLPKCNHVIAFDLPSTTKEYVQFKEKTRNESSRLCFIIERGSNEKRRLFDLAKQERLLLEKCKDGIDLLADTEKVQPTSSVVDEKDLLPAYQPNPNQISANASNAIAIVNRYCLKLPSDSFTKLFPQCTVDAVDNDRFVCKIRLPINSPIRHQIVGQPMSTVKLAKKSCAIQVCRVLYENGEIDENFLPVGKESLHFTEKLGLKPTEEELEDLKNEARTGTTKKRRYYDKRVAKVLQGSTIQPDQDCYLYLFSMHLTCPIPDEQNTRGRRIVDPANFDRCFAMLINRPVPKICSFPVFTRSGEVCVQLKPVPGKLRFDRQQLNRLINFHKFTFKNVLQLERYPMKFNVEQSNCSYLLVPVDYNVRQDDSQLVNARIDWSFLEMIDKYEEKSCSEIAMSANQTGAPEELIKYEFDSNVYQDAVVRPWYRTNEFQFYFYVAQICEDLTPMSEFPDDHHCSFADYYQKKYKVRITNMNQPLLDVDHTSARLNLLTPRYVNRKGVTLPMSSDKTKKEKRDNLNKKQLLVPELCIVHPFPASFWKKAVCMPCILYRVNSLLLSDELRHEVCQSTAIGKLDLDSDQHWPPLDFGWTLAEVLEKNNADPIQNSSKTAATAAAATGANKSSNEMLNATNTSSSNDDSFVIDTFDPEKHKVDISRQDWGEFDDSYEEEEDELMKDINLEDVKSNSLIFNINNQKSSAKNGFPAMWKTGPMPPSSSSKTTMDGHNLDKEQGFEPPRSASACSWTDTDVDSAIQMLDVEGPGLSSISLGNSNLTNLNMDGLSKDLAKLRSEQMDNLLNEYESDDDFSVDMNPLHDEEAAEFDPTYVKSSLITVDTISDKKEEVLKEVLNNGIAVRGSNKNDDDMRSVLKLTPQLGLHEPIATIDVNLDSKFEFKQFVPDHSFEQEEDETVDLDHFIRRVKQLETLETKVKQPEKSRKEEKWNMMHSYAGDLAACDEDDTEDIEPCFGELLPCRQKILDRQNHQQSTSFTIRFDALKNEYDDSLGPSPAMILQALTMSNAGDGINLERLETVGDSFLKYAVTAYLYCVCEKIHEGKLSYLRSRQISNYNLFRLGREKRLGEVMIATKFEPSDNWLPPTFVIPKGLEKALVDLSLENNTSIYSIEPLKDVINSDANETLLREAIEKHRTQCIIQGTERVRESDDEAEPTAVVGNADGNRKKKGFKETTTTATNTNSVNNHVTTKFNYVPYNLLTQQSIPDKSIADCVESLIGAYLISSGPKGALMFMKWLGLKVMPEDLHNLNQDAQDPIWHWLPKVPSPLTLSEELTLEPLGSPDFQSKFDHVRQKLESVFYGYGLDVFERNVLGYEFKDKSYLVQAFTHNSFYDNRMTDCYQRLEFLGDAVLDFLITRYLYEDPAKHSPGVLTDLRSALVNNTFFASLAVKYGFHKFLKVLSSDLFKVISNFVNKFNQEDEHWLSRTGLLYVEEGEGERNEDVEVPKALGDIFESVAGAIFLDSGMSLDAVWNVYFAMMKPEIEYFSKNVPKSPIRELLEMKPQNVKFGKAEIVTGRKISVCVEVFGEGKFVGIGRNKRLAKSTAAKKALRYLKSKERNEDYF